jgi:hypothetical protein
MAKGFHNVGNGFKKGFDSVYYAKVSCPVCKEKIYANALMCPNCKTDFKKSPYNKMKTWQNTAMKIVLILALLISFSICLSGAPIIIGIIIGFALYGGGYVIVQKVQSFKNYHEK